MQKLTTQSVSSVIARIVVVIENIRHKFVLPLVIIIVIHVGFRLVAAIQQVITFSHASIDSVGVKGQVHGVINMLHSLSLIGR